MDEQQLKYLQDILTSISARRSTPSEHRLSEEIALETGSAKHRHSVVAFNGHESILDQ